MHDHDPSVREAENFRYAFLSASASQLLQRGSGEPLSTEEARQLDLIGSFLSEVIAGANLVTKGETAGVSASRAVDALGYVLGPVETLQGLDLTSEGQLLKFFEAMRDTIAKSAQERRLVGDANIRAAAATLFAKLNERILSTLSERRSSVGAARTPTDALW